ncbi:hypothetical protein HI914_03329 [Erysiphe necator]|uniref:Uncharacterized protein n=1 Tax=Uncinula necator TaxID=52586 RepID=A0A0B1PC85_UNCNE|nr:hypothetical protein HI914_03329 [Erysiphe necator]KHJ34975.1 hypothetical protein EV44_g2167 [Erysiphe necator]
MAFHQPTLQVSKKWTSSVSEGFFPQLAQPQQHQRARQRQQPPDSQEWVLFDPIGTGSTELSYKNSDTRTFTLGCSQVSDVRSLESGVWSYNVDESLEGGDENEREEEELDSLDSHLLDFKSEPNASYDPEPEPVDTVLPTHDGLGSFRLGRTIMGQDIQQYLYKFEKFNPNRSSKPREESEVDQMKLDTHQLQDAEWLRRIQVWRLEQSRVLDEIQRESRQKKHGTIKARNNTAEELAQETIATLSGPVVEATSDEKESFLSRITRKVIQDLIGIDDNLLSIIFGESLACDSEKSKTSELHQDESSKVYDQISWEYKILQHIARELEKLANKISDSPLRLNTYLHPQNIAISYAGLPIIPENIDSQSPLSQDLKLESSFLSGPFDPEFHSTVKTRAQSTPHLSSITSNNSDDKEKTPHAREGLKRELTRDEWERDLDLKLVFRYIFDRVATRFSSSSSPSNSNQADSTKQRTVLGTVDTATRAACVRRHHPLISGRAAKKKSIRPINRTWTVSVPHSSVPGGTPSPRPLGVNFNTHKNSSLGSGSCAGEQGKKVMSESSRNYWDWAESVGSSKTTPGIGTMGSWGEV